MPPTASLSTLRLTVQGEPTPWSARVLPRYAPLPLLHDQFPAFATGAPQTRVLLDVQSAKIISFARQIELIDAIGERCTIAYSFAEDSSGFRFRSYLECQWRDQTEEDTAFYLVTDSHPITDCNELWHSSVMFGRGDMRSIIKCNSDYRVWHEKTKKIIFVPIYMKMGSSEIIYVRLRDIRRTP